MTPRMKGVKAAEGEAVANREAVDVEATITKRSLAKVQKEDVDKEAHREVEGMTISKFIVSFATNLVIILLIVGIMMLTKLKRRLIM